MVRNGYGGVGRAQRGVPPLRLRPVTVALATWALVPGCLHLASLPGWDAQRDAPPAVDRLWTPPAKPAVSLDDLPPPNRSLPPRDPASIDRAYDVADLVDVALQLNPETRRAWEEARAAAAGLGRAFAPYYPEVGTSGEWGPQRFAFQTAPEPTTIHQNYSVPSVQLTWTLVDFGRRASGLEEARERLLAAGLGFNRKIQEIVFRTQTAFFLLDAARARVEAAEQNLELARTVREAVEDRLALGLATEPAALLARQAEAKAAYELEDARAAVSDARSRLAVAIGVPANAPFEVVSLASLPLPAHLDTEVDELVEATVRQRPDLAARAADVRAREAAAEHARAELYPEIGFTGHYGVDLTDFSTNGAPQEPIDSPNYSALLGFSWRVFTGFERLNAIRQAEAANASARSALVAVELEAIAETWRAVHDFRAALKKYQFAEALLRASQNAYTSNAETYRQGLSTVTELLQAESDLAGARYTLIQSRAQVLLSSAAIAYATGAIDPAATPAAGAPPTP